MSAQAPLCHPREPTDSPLWRVLHNQYSAASRRPPSDLTATDGITSFKPQAELEEAYARLIPSKDSTVVVTGSTGHQASHTRFVLQHLPGYRNVLWYDGGWAEWANRPELPVEKKGAPT